METKPGYKTTEFWVTVIAKIIALIAALGYLTPEQSSTLTQAVVQLSGVVGMVAAAFGYSIARGKAKAGVKPE